MPFVCGVPLGTVQKVLLGITKCPRYDTIRALECVFKPVYDSMVRETSAYNVTVSQDKFKKGNKYWNAGVREYWLVDPTKKMVCVYRYELEDVPTMYTFEEENEEEYDEE